MRVERDERGDFQLESADIATRFGLPLASLRRLMELGLVKSSVEVGEGEDTGKCRLTLRCGNRIWRAILDERDEIESEQMSVTRAAAPDPGPGKSDR
jgi:hypothetical protein